MYRETVGIIGGFGAYATLDFYKRLLQEFASDNERNYPHMILDNDFTMPSRTRALLYDEAYEEVVKAISESIDMMLQRNVSKIVLVCGTAHYFLPDVYRILPEARDRVVNMIDALGEELQERKISNVLVIAAEGALKKDLYKNELEQYEIDVEQPGESEYKEIRYFIESVKQNRLCEETVDRFKGYIKSKRIENVILGCTEFPVLLKYVKDTDTNGLDGYRFWDPLEIVISCLRKILI